VTELWIAGWLFTVRLLLLDEKAPWYVWVLCALLLFVLRPLPLGTHVRDRWKKTP
jgi:hypothetical protein